VGKRYVAGFKKFARLCKTSRKLRHQLAWVNTCCIDKTNAVELGEAIHGFYKWYASSYLHVVYLAGSTSCAGRVGGS
jgi:hypothetical protein